MESLQEQVKQVCRLADNAILNPMLSPMQMAHNIGLSAGVIGFVGGFGVLAGPVLFSPPLAILYNIWEKYSNAKKKELEKERMLREIIAKQQTVIRKLEEEVKKSTIQNVNNKMEIDNLNEMLRILKDTENQVIKAA